ncbi:MAG: hypothetical protein M1169_02025 [Firmicutes bacterium]|nr:hypothetical protein [Bacillota bacterium]
MSGKGKYKCPKHKDICRGGKIMAGKSKSKGKSSKNEKSGILDKFKKKVGRKLLFGK